MHTDDLFNELGILKLDDVYKLNVGKFVFSYMKKELPLPIMNIYTLVGDIQTHNTRSQKKYRIQPQNRRILHLKVYYTTAHKYGTRSRCIYT